MTKHVQGSNAFEANDDFAVYGFKELTSASTKTTVFDDVVVSTTDGSAWTYSPLRFWDLNCDRYTFYAISPASIGTGGNVNPQTGAITSSSTALTFSGNDNDILVADKTVVNKASEKFNNWSAVELKFNHIASLFDLKVKKASSLNTTGIVVKVKSITLNNVGNAGTFSVSDAYNYGVPSTTTGNHPVTSWTVSGTGTYNNESGVTAVTINTVDGSLTGLGPEGSDVKYIEVTGTAENSANDLINTLIVIPQTLNPESGTAPSLTIVYTIETRNGSEVIDRFTQTANVDLKLFITTDRDDNTGTAIEAWAPGTHYTYYITLDAHAIQFTASINSWQDVNGYYHIMM